MAEHVAALIGGGGIPAVDVIAGVDDQDVALLDLHPLLDVLGGVDAEVLHLIPQIHHHAGGAELGQLQGGDVTAGGIEMQGAVQVGAHVVGVGDELAVGAVGGQTLEELHLQGLIGGPGGRVDTQGDGEIVHFDVRPLAHKNTSICFLSGSVCE